MTEATPEARARSRELRRQRVARNPNRLCPPDHKHGATSTCVNGHGCRCRDCVSARSRRKREDYYGARSITGVDVKVSSLGVRRRLEALACMGWSCEAVAVRIGAHPRPVNRWRSGERAHVMRSTHDAIDRVFRELAYIPAPGRSGQVTRTVAKARGYVPAVAWDDVDDPRERPKGVQRAA